MSNLAGPEVDLMYKGEMESNTIPSSVEIDYLWFDEKIANML